MVKILETTRLRINNQAAFLKQIASVYSSFYRAAMEYIDNAADAAAEMRQKAAAFGGTLLIEIDTKSRSVSFTDNCGGMDQKQLANLVAGVGDSGKRSQSWTNGQFGFGLQAFRGFARYVKITSMAADGKVASITIDADASDDATINVIAEPVNSFPVPGTKVVVFGFRSHVFSKAYFAKGLVGETQLHFDDILRSKLLVVEMMVDDGPRESIEAFDFASLPGVDIREQYTTGSGLVIDVNLKILEKLHENRFAVLLNKGRRIQLISELRSYRSYVKAAGRTITAWQDPFVTGSVEINGFVDPMLTRDDLKEGEDRDELYSVLLKVQLAVEEKIRERTEKKRDDAFSKIGNKMSECLAAILRRYKLQFDGSSTNTSAQGNGVKPGEGVPFGGEEAGGGGVGPDGVAGGGDKAGKGGDKGPGDDPKGGGSDDTSQAARSDQGTNAAGGTSNAPEIKFFPYGADSGRVIPFGSTLSVNTAHADFTARQPRGSRVTPRMIAYVAQVVAGPCVEYLYAKRGRPLIAAAVAQQVADISIALEAAFTDSGMLEELYATPTQNFEAAN